MRCAALQLTFFAAQPNICHQFFHEIGVYGFSFQLFKFLTGSTMRRERALKVVLVLVGLLFSAGVYPLVMFVRQEPALAMMLSLYVTLGVFLLLAARNPSANRSLIAFTAWSSFAHAGVMGVQAFRNLIPRGELLGVAALIVIGVALISLAPAKQPVERVSADVV